MPTARNWTCLLGRHLVIRRAREMGFAEIEQHNLIRCLERTGLFSPEELLSWSGSEPRSARELMGLNLRLAGFLEQTSSIESQFSSERRQEMVSAIFSFMEEVTGLPAAMIRDLFTDIRWTSPSLQEVIMGGGLTAPARRTSLETVLIPERKRLLALVAKRLTHDLIIHGNSLRLFYQGLPLMRGTLDRVHPNLTNLYMAFAASLQLMMLLYGGPFPDGAAVRAGRVEVGIKEQVFKIRASAINFPSLFNEIIKGFFEALLHPGMPTAEELGDDEVLFRELTAGPDLEFELMKVAPEASLRMHHALVACRDHDPKRVGQLIRMGGFGDFPPSGEVYLLYRAFARLSPAKSQAFACRAIMRPMEPMSLRAYVRILNNQLDR
jgi:hypothetical protein